MTGEIYNELFQDFVNLYNFKKKNEEKTVGALEKLKKMAEQNGGIVDMSSVDNPYVWLVEYYEMINNIILKLKSIDESYTTKYYKQFEDGRVIDTENVPKYPQIFICFRKLVKSVDEENYEESNRLKTKILEKY